MSVQMPQCRADVPAAPDRIGELPRRPSRLAWFSIDHFTVLGLRALTTTPTNNSPQDPVTRSGIATRTDEFVGAWGSLA